MGAGVDVIPWERIEDAILFHSRAQGLVEPATGGALWRGNPGCLRRHPGLNDRLANRTGGRRSDCFNRLGAQSLSWWRTLARAAGGTPALLYASVSNLPRLLSTMSVGCWAAWGGTAGCCLASFRTACGSPLAASALVWAAVSVASWTWFCTDDVAFDTVMVFLIAGGV